MDYDMAGWRYKSADGCGCWFYDDSEPLLVSPLALLRSFIRPRSMMELVARTSPFSRAAWASLAWRWSQWSLISLARAISLV